MCGFDSVPSDMCTYEAARELGRLYGQSPAKARTFVAMHGTVSGGTIRTGLDLKQKFNDDYNNTHLLSHPEKGATPTEWEGDLEQPAFDTWALMSGSSKEAQQQQRQQPQQHQRRQEENAREKTEGDFDLEEQKEKEGEEGIWTGPFTMAKINSRVVRRSSMLFDQQNSEADVNANANANANSNFEYSEVMVAKNEKLAANMTKHELTSPDFIAKLVERKRLPRPGQVG